MKKALLYSILIFTLTVQAQDNSTNILNAITAKTNLLFENQLIKGEAVASKIQTTFGDSYAYNKEYRIQVNDRLYYEIGEIQLKTYRYSVMLIQSKNATNSSQLEFLIIYKKEKTKQESTLLDATRERWVELCNSHKVDKLVSELYHKEAYYYNRGRLLQGTSTITKEYSYMNSPNYSLKLSPKHIVFASSTIAYELGRCSGSYPLPYLLVWQKQPDTTWQILLDSNY